VGDGSDESGSDGCPRGGVWIGVEEIDALQSFKLEATLIAWGYKFEPGSSPLPSRLVSKAIKYITRD
jgi:hypothetical protein